uniref:Uncharacterized protein n=1 Tax=Cannabis sativa TaxID=3483 RepID=A0A803QIZ8_CANSA
MSTDNNQTKQGTHGKASIQTIVGDPQNSSLQISTSKNPPFTMERIQDIPWFLNLSRDKTIMCLGAGPWNSPSQSRTRLVSWTILSLNPHLLIKFFIMHGYEIITLLSLGF